MTAALAVGAIHLALVQPNHPAALTPRALLVFPLELPVILLGLVLARGALCRAMRALVGGSLTAMSVLKLADFAANAAYVRPFNPVLDMHLLPASWRMLSGAVGLPAALAAVAALVVGLALLGAALWWAAGRIARIDPPRGLRVAAAVLLAPAAILALLDAAREVSPVDPPGAAFTGRLAWEHLRDGLRSGGDLARFRAEAAGDGFADLPGSGLMPALQGADVFLVFVESYGRAALENPLYAPTITATLEGIEERLAARGLAMRSGFLTAPMVGGQSWLAHASVLSGLWIDNQRRYAALLASPRRTLLHLARRAGWRTVAVMPAITLAWPESGYFGYDRVLAADDLQYRGLPFNWVTMPDQFTLAQFERLALAEAPRAPVFAEIALISSHAPWTPIPPLIPWDEVGDGRVFDPHAVAGEPPSVVWRDQDRVRDQYRQALDYTLRVVGGFAERRADTALLIVVLGDHQPAAFVSGDPSGRDVPIHVIGARDQVALLEGWDWTPGLIPAQDAPAWPMSAFRDRFLAAFGSAAPPVSQAAGPAARLP